MSKLRLSIVIFINGLCLMVLEMVGARLLAPWLGTSIIVWTSLIGVILAFLSLGYWMGGQLADKTLTSYAERVAKKQHIPLMSHPQTILSGLIVSAALFVMVTALIQMPVLSFLSQYISSLYVATLLAAVVLFAFPSMFFGMISPYIMRVAITHQNEAGTTIGKLNAVATIGSIVGTFLGGFVLVAWFGSQQIVYGIAACLLATSAFVQLQPIKPKAITLVLLIGGCALQFFAANAQKNSSITTIETAYNTLQVVEHWYEGEEAIFLRTDPGAMQSGMFVNRPTDLMFDYTKQFMLPVALLPNASKVLMLGGGGYSIPSWLLSAQSPLKTSLQRLDVVEIDPGITAVAHKYFALPTNDNRLHVYDEDARIFINNAAAKNEEGVYDLIFTDVFNSYYSVPFQAGTQEAAKNTSKLLRSDGIFMMNIISAIEGKQGQMFRAIYHAYAQAFPYTYVFPVHDNVDGFMVQNIMLMASKQPLDLDRVAQLQGQAALTFQQQWLHPIAADVPPLADNFAPVDRYLQYSMNSR